ncbi:MFS transporter [Nocardia cyriacigeorgica]|uniref:MFS transporter n=1 Tax=Nocardia cyriacigeorgica TaxID=135487 RepID=UPI000CEA2E0B|nr:MFS transporter [Nocardia cyriacigeorgica]PPJ02550.1 MFS transporter [Nocardia cyriacigeorgica]
MTDTDLAVHPGRSGLDAGGRRRVLAVLCLTEITSWGILYYAFPVLSVSVSQQSGWSLPLITAAFSIGQLACAVTGIPVGRLLDRTGPRRVMTIGSAAAAAGLVVVATAPNPVVFAAGWVLSGAGMGAVLYPPAFAALTRWWGEDRVRALTMLTLAAGLASTVFAPVTAVADRHLDWRATYLLLAAILAAVTIPAHWFGLRGPWPHPPAPPHHDFTDHTAITRSRGFTLLTLTLCLGAFVTFAGVFNLVALLREQGLDPELAALALGLGGAGQVAGRLGYSWLADRTSVTTRTVAVLAATAATTALLGVGSGALVVISIAIGAGVVRGVFTLIQATVITDRWGATHYGRLNGLVSAPVVVVSALAPWAGTALSAWTGSYAHTYLILAAVAVAAALTAAATSPPRPQPTIVKERL